MDGLTVLSLFDGIACGRLALERAGIPVKQYIASEIEPNAIKVATSHYPDIQQIGDVCKVNARELPQIDILIGGSPCQGFSASGKGLNFSDPRSKLFFEYVRILMETKPRYFLLENVKMKKSGKISSRCFSVCNQYVLTPVWYLPKIVSACTGQTFPVLNNQPIRISSWRMFWKTAHGRNRGQLEAGG